MERASTGRSGPHDQPSAADESLRWFVRLRSGDATDEDRRRFQAWLKKQQSHREEFDKLTGLWSELDEAGPLLEQELDRADAELKLAENPSVPCKRRWSVYGLSTALAASLLLVIAGGWWFAGRAEITEYRTAKGEQQTVALPDGSRMVLNTETAVTAETSLFRRTMMLHKGEALFVVAHETRRPFEVVAGGGMVRDIGTQFAVRREPEQVTVTVVEGAVEVQSSIERAQTQRGRVLTAGERVSYGEEGGLSPVAMVDIPASTAWTVGQIMFEQRPLAEVIRELGRYQQVEIRVLDPHLGELKISGRFGLHDREGFLRAVEATAPVKLTRVNADLIVMEELRISSSRR
ncbi:MAG: DUF4880 domain-containing protein [Nitrospira sp. CR1.3]|nr:DUF4880 domain-containing protein [Nitrospira sp. CR1.3]